MKNLLGILVVLAVVIGVVAYNRGWFEVKKDPDSGKLSVEVHKDKFRQDRDAARQKMKDAGTAVSKRMSDLTKRAGEAKTPDEKARLEQEIAALKKRMEELEEQKRRLDELGEEGSEEVMRKLGTIQQELDDKLRDMEIGKINDPTKK